LPLLDVLPYRADLLELLRLTGKRRHILE